MKKLMAQLQSQMQSAQKIAETVIVKGTAGAGAVEVEMNGKMEIISVKVSSQALQFNDVEMLGDLFLAASKDAHARANKAVEDKISVGIGNDLR